jgi:predicted ABC-type ATPase
MKDLPEPTQAALDLLEGFRDTRERWSVETSQGTLYAESRRELHRELMSQALNGVKGATGDPQIIFMAGGSGSGKSVLSRRVARPTPRALRIDGDLIKLQLPEYVELAKLGDGYAAVAVHEEASDIAAELLRRGIEMRANIVVDATGDAEPGKFVGKLRSAANAGYVVSVVYADVPVELAIARCAERAVQEGREVPESVIRSLHREVARRFGEVIEEKFLKRTAVYNTDVAPGSKPTLIAEQRRGQDLRVLDRARFAAFLAKADPERAHPRPEP